MGEAKRRGTAEERQAQAIEQNASIFKLIEQGEAPHYAFILDRSPKGAKVLAELKKAPGEIQARMASPAVQLWESAHFPYVAIWGTWGMTGGVTIHALDLENLLDKALPAVMERTLEKGGLCTFVPGVDDSILDQVMAKIAELQPTTENSLNGERPRPH